MGAEIIATSLFYVAKPRNADLGLIKQISSGIYGNNTIAKHE